MMRAAKLSGLSFVVALTVGSTCASAFFDYQYLTPIPSGGAWILGECDTEMQLGVYKVPLPYVLQKIAEENGAPAGEYDLIIDSARWGAERALLISREDLVIKPKPQKEKVVHGMKVKLIPAGISQQYMDDWKKAFDTGFKYEALFPLKKGMVPSKPKPFAMVVDIPYQFVSVLTPWDNSNPALVKVVSQDFDKQVLVKKENVRFKNLDGRWKAYSFPPAERPWTPNPSAKILPPAAETPPVTKGR